MKRGWGMIIGFIGLAGCTTIYNPATQQQEMVLNSSIEQALGSMARAQMGLRSLSVGKVKPEDLQRVQEIGRRIAQVSDRQDVPYRFGVIKKKSINAFTLPGGTIYVHTGLLDKATEDELASVIAHEVGHVAARHVAKHLQADIGFALLLQIASRTGAGAESARVANSLYGLFSRGFSRQDELEADRLAIRYLHRAGVDPKGLISFFKVLQEEHPENPLDKTMVWRSTHPLTSQRIAEAEKELLKLEGENFCPTCGRRFSPRLKYCTVDGTPLRKKKVP